MGHLIFAENINKHGHQCIFRSSKIKFLFKIIGWWMIKTSLAVFEQISGDMMSLDWYKIDICPMRGLWPLGQISILYQSSDIISPDICSKTANNCKYLRKSLYNCSKRCVCNGHLITRKSLGDFLWIQTPNTDQLNPLFHTFAEFRLLVNRDVARQSTDWLVANAQFSPNETIPKPHICVAALFAFKIQDRTKQQAAVL